MMKAIPAWLDQFLTPSVRAMLQSGAEVEIQISSSGRCSACGLAFGARRGQRRQVAHVLGVHEEICPGGDRAGEVVFPLGR